MNSISRSFPKLFQLFALIIVASSSIAWTGDFSSPQNSFHSLLAAAQTSELDNFLECCDLESMTGEKVTDQTIDQIKQSLKEDPYRKEFVQKITRYLKSAQFKTISENTLSPEMKTLLIEDTKTKEQALLLFRKRNSKWKLSSLKPVNAE